MSKFKIARERPKISGVKLDLTVPLFWIAMVLIIFGVYLNFFRSYDDRLFVSPCGTYRVHDTRVQTPAGVWIPKGSREEAYKFVDHALWVCSNSKTCFLESHKPCR